MDSKRQLKFARQIQKDIADVFQNEGKVYIENNFVTVTQVRVSPDLSFVRIYLSFLNNDTAKTSLETIKENISSLRYHLAKRIKNQVRVIPEIGFYIDDTQSYVAKINELFSTIEIPKDSDTSVTE
jgi:ribosome-binding factor A